MGQIGKNTKILTEYVQNTLPLLNIQNQSKFLDTLRVLEDDAKRLEDQLDTCDTLSKPAVHTALITAHYCLEILKSKQFASSLTKNLLS